MDDKELNNISNNLPNNVNPQKTERLVPQEQKNVPEAKNDDQTEDVLDPETNGNNNSKVKKPNTNSKKDAGETEDVLDPEAEKNGSDSKRKKDNNDKKDDRGEKDSGDSNKTDNGNNGNEPKGNNGGEVKPGEGSPSGQPNGQIEPSGNIGGNSNVGGLQGGTGGQGLGATEGTSGIVQGPGGLAHGAGGTGGSGIATGTGGTGIATGAGGTGVATGAGGTGIATGAGGTGIATGAGGTGIATGAGGAGVATGAGGAGTGAMIGGLGAGGIIILIVIVLVGLIAFIFNMPGLMIGKLKEFAQELWDGVQSVFTTEADAFINDDDVVNLAQYLIDMEYGVVEYGFIRAEENGDDDTYLDLEDTGYLLNRDGIYVDSNGTPYNGKYYNATGDLIDNSTGKKYVDGDYTKDKYGIEYWASDGEKDGKSHTKGQIASLEDAESSLLRAYLMADYRICVLRNDDEGLFNDCFDSIKKTFGGTPNAWSKGLIKIYKKTDDGVANLWYGLSTLWWDDANITDNGTKLSIRNGYFNRPMEFELDGWTGRYGLSLEFLLSLHLGTMAPDLVTAMLQSFDTVVQVYVESIDDAQVLTKYKDYEVDSYEEDIDDNNEEVTIESLNEVLNDEYLVGIQDGFFVEWVNGLSLTKKKCQSLLLNSGLSSPPNCIYKAVGYVILRMQMKDLEYSTWMLSEDDNYLSYIYHVDDPLLEEFEYRVKDGDDEYYTPYNSLYSLRNYYKLGVEVDPNSTAVSDGLNEYVYPDRQEAIEKAKEFNFPDDMSLEPSIDEKFAEDVVTDDNYVYRIERDIIAKDWTMYGYIDGDDFVLGTEEDFNKETGGHPWEETTGYLNSYIYKIYQVGIKQDGKIQYYKDGIASDKGKFIHQFAVDFVYREDIFDDPKDYEETIEEVISIYYDEDHGDTFMERFRFFDKSGNELSYLENGMDGVWEDSLSITIYKEFQTTSGGATANIYATYDADAKEFYFTIGDYMGSPYQLCIIEGETEAVFSEETVTSGNSTAVSDEILYDVLYLNFVVRDKSLEELVKCRLLDKDENGNYIPIEDGGTCSTDKDLTKCCTICQRYVKKVIKALAQVQDTDYSYYQPYIARVVGSWFRDTYFIIPEEEDGALVDYYGSGNSPVGSYGSDGRYVKVDEEYLNASGEYWTEYEMKKDEDGNETDEYQLYYLNPNGSTSNDTLEKWLEEEHDGKKYKNQEEAELAGYVFVKRAKLLSIQDVKENTQKTDDSGGGRDLDEAPYMDDTVWSAYSVGDGGDSGWIKINRGEVNAVDDVLDMVDDKGEFYYKLTSTKSIEQEEDAIRTETNVTVKNLFRYRQFYIYDGTIARAEAIQKDREKVIELAKKFIDDKGIDAKDDLNKYGRYAIRETYGDVTLFANSNDVAEQWLEWQLDIYYGTNELTIESDKFKLDELCEYGISEEYENEDGEKENEDGEKEKYLDATYYTKDGHTLDPRDKDLIATVNITKSSLDAFSILENVNTLDSDYQYRDFKELIVELNYFDKEDLSEAIEEVFTWLVPTYITRWPILGIDKQNNDYGTLVHSQESIDFLIKVYEKLVEEEKALREEQGVELPEQTQDPDNSDDESKVDMKKVYYIGDSWMENMKNGKVTESSDDYFTSAVGKRAGDSEFDNIQVKSDASCIVIMLGLNGPTTQSEMKALLDDLSSRYSSKTIYVLKVFHVGRNYTNMDKDEVNSLIDTYNSDISTYCSTKENLKFVDATTGLIDSEGYLSPDYETSDGMHLTSYKKLYDNIRDCIKKSVAEDKPQTENEQILSQLKETESYTEQDAVISPVTGKIISYGEHSRINVYTNEIEKVGFVKIQIMSYGEDKDDASKSYFTVDMLSGTEVEEDKKEDIVKGLNAFYDEYKEQCAGYILMIDGIDVTELKNGFSSITDSDGNAVEYDSLCTYEKNEVTALYNSKEQKKREEAEDLKAEAPYFMNYNANYVETNGEYTAQDKLGGYYIKEGAYLGKAQEATTRTGEKREENAGNAQEKNPNLSDDSELVKDDTKITVDIQKIYDEFLEDKNPSYLRMILQDVELTVVDNVEDFFPGFEEEEGSKEGIYGDLESITDESSVEEKIRAAMTYYVSQGFTPEGAAGILGNLLVESYDYSDTRIWLYPALDTHGSAGYRGLACWNYNWFNDQKAWMSENGYNENDFAGQVRAVYESPNTGGMDESKWNELKGLTNEKQACELFCVYYEACPGNVSGSAPTEWYKTGSMYQGLATRKTYATEALEIYQNESATWNH